MDETSLSIHTHTHTVGGRKMYIEFRVREPTDWRPLLLAISSREIRDEGVTSDFFPFLTNFFILPVQRFFSTLYPLLPKWRARHQTTPFLLSRYKIIEISFKVIKYLLLYLFLYGNVLIKKEIKKKYKYLLLIKIYKWNYYYF